MTTRLRYLLGTWLLVTSGCNLWPGGIGQVDMPDRGRTDVVEPTMLYEEANRRPKTLEGELKKVKERKPVPEQAPPQIVQNSGPLTHLALDEMRVLVLQNNLQLAVERLAPDIADAKVSAEEGRFDALIGAHFRYQDKESPRIDGPLVDFSSENPGLDDEIVKLTEIEQEQSRTQFGLGVTVPLPTGGAISLKSLLDQKSIDDPQSFDQYLAATEFSLSQPLLRNAGSDANLAPIRISRVNKRIAEVRTKLATLRILTRAEKAYWELDAARRILDVRAEQFRMASQNFEQVRQLVGEGLAPQVEIARSEVGVFQQLEKLIVAETAWQLRQRDLKVYLASSRFPLRGAPMVETTTRPKIAGLSLNRDALIENALQVRPELIEAELKIIRAEINEDFRENQVLPIANLDFRYGSLDRDSSLGSAWGSHWDFDNQQMAVGLSVEIPLTNQRQRALADEARLIRTRELASRRARELMVREEVLDMVDVIERHWQLILAARQAVIVAGVNYEAERRQFQEGMRTSREVLEALSDLGEARIREARAMLKYQVSQVDLAFATGTLLGYAQVSLAPLPINE